MFLLLTLNILFFAAVFFCLLNTTSDEIDSERVKRIAFIVKNQFLITKGRHI